MLKRALEISTPFATTLAARGPLAWRQSTATLNGHVLDPSDAWLPAPQITLRSESTGAEHTVRADSRDALHRPGISGIYEFPFHDRRIVEDWQLAAIVQVQSGSPVTIATGTSTVREQPDRYLT